MEVQTVFHDWIASRITYKNKNSYLVKSMRVWLAKRITDPQQIVVITSAIMTNSILCLAHIIIVINPIESVWKFEVQWVHVRRYWITGTELFLPIINNIDFLIVLAILGFHFGGAKNPHVPSRQHFRQK